MGVNVDASALGLLEQFFKVQKVVTTHQNARTGLHADIHMGDFRMTKAGCIGTVQKCHGFYAKFAGFLHQSDKIINAELIISGGIKRFLHKNQDAVIFCAEHISVVCIGSNTLEPVNNELTQGAHIFV